MSIRPPVIILARPQMGENIGAAARAMKNCGLVDLRLVQPRDGWPNPAAEPMAAGGRDILERARVYDGLSEACHDIDFLLATSARPRDLAKPMVGVRTGAASIVEHHGKDINARAALLFGSERSGLNNDELAIADVIVQADLDSGGQSLNLGQAVMILAWEWRSSMLEFQSATRPETRAKTRAENQSETPPIISSGAPVISSGDRLSSISERDYFFQRLENLLEEKGFFPSAEMAPAVKRNLRVFFTRGQPSKQELQTLQGVLTILTRDKRE